MADVSDTLLLCTANNFHSMFKIFNSQHFDLNYERLSSRRKLLEPNTNLATSTSSSPVACVSYFGFIVISERNRIELWQKNGCNQTRIVAKGWLFTQAIECDPMFDCFHSYGDLRFNVRKLRCRCERQTN